jgi:hypothetical protein
MVRTQRRPGRALVSLFVVLLLCVGPVAQAYDVTSTVNTEVMFNVQPQEPYMVPETEIWQALSNIDGFFTENKGQLGEGAGKYYCRGSPLSVAFGTGWVAYDLQGDGDEGALFRVMFKGANPVEPVGVDPLPHLNNYFIGIDPEGWVTGVRNYREVMYPGIYDGIDLRYRLTEDRLKYDFILEPGADPTMISFNYEGIEALSLDDGSGNLNIKTAAGTIRDEAPVAFQYGPDGRNKIPASFHLRSDITIGVAVDEYSRELPLIIDPSVSFSTFIGGSDSDNPTDMFVDDDGNVYIIGGTNSANFPTTTGAYLENQVNVSIDGFVIKINNNGTSAEYCTYIGGSLTDVGRAIDVNSSGYSCIVGSTESDDFPITEGVVQDSLATSGDTDLFITMLNENGSGLVYSTFLGGVGLDMCAGIRLDTQGNISISGITESSDFPTVIGSFDTSYNGGMYDIFVSKLNPTASRLIYSTFIGGSDSDGIGPVSEHAGGFEIDGSGSVYIGGWTSSVDFPTTASAYTRLHKGDVDTLIVKVNASGSSLDYSTYLGGSDSDYISDVHVDESGYVYVAGVTKSANFPTTQDAYDRTRAAKNDGFVTKMNPSLSRLEFSTFIGGNGNDPLRAIDVDEFGQAYVTGRTASSDYPTTSDALDSKLSGLNDALICIISSNGTSLVYCSYLGGGDTDAGYSIDYDSGNLTVSGWTYSNNFPTGAGVFDPQYNGDYDIFLTRIIPIPINASVPGVPENITLETADRTVTISWDPPGDTGGVPLMGYNLYRGTSGDNMTWIKMVSHYVVSHADYPPLMGRPYFYSVSGFNIKGEGNKSSIMNITPYGSPLEPLNFLATPGCGTIELTWSAPIDTGAMPIQGYRLFRGETFDNIQHLTDLDNVIRYTDQDLVNGRTYYYAILAFNIIGDGKRSETSAMPLGPPSPPLNPRASAGDDHVKVQWDKPSSDGGSLLLGYRVLRGLSRDQLSVLASVETTVTSYTDFSVTNGVEYQYAVLAFNMLGDGQLSSVVSAVPMGLPGAPEGFAVEASDGQVALIWEPPTDDGGSPILGYAVFRGLTEQDMAQFDIVNEDTGYTDAGLVNGQTFYYAVRAFNVKGDGPLSAVLEVTPLALPDPPGDLVAEAGNRIVTLMWLRTSEDGGSEVTNYFIHCGNSPNTLEPLKMVGKSIFNYQDTDVDVGTIYYYAVAAVTLAGEGPISVIASATPYGPPSVPLSFVATPGDGEVSMTWTPPEDDGASPIDGYVIMRGTTTASLRELTQLGDVTSYLDTTVTNDPES